MWVSPLPALLAILALLPSAASISLQPSLSPNPVLTKRASKDAGDFSWVKRWAAIGDSFTAGIGSGTGRYPDKLYDAWMCSRYNQAYPALLNKEFGPSVKDFQYTACSGDKTVGIWNQANDLDGNLDLVVLTAGGNDMCLSEVIKKCIFFGWFLTNESICDEMIATAINNLEVFIKDNIRAVVGALADKVNDDGLVVFNMYAEFFNEAEGDCNGQCWYLIDVAAAVELTKERRHTFNSMVRDLNHVIQQVVDEATADPAIKFKIVTSDWNLWVTEAVDGQFCDPESSPEYPDPQLPELQFFKPNTDCGSDGRAELRRRELENGGNKTVAMSAADIEFHEAMKAESRESHIHNKAIWETTRDPGKVVLGRLDPRQTPKPFEPLCGRKTVNDTGIPIPDMLGKMFHPNEKGHRTIASFVLAHLMEFRSGELDVVNPLCKAADEFKCWKAEGRKGYVNSDLVYKSKDDFCDHERPTLGEKGWRISKTYYKGSPEEHTLVIDVDDETEFFEQDKCKSSFRRILDGCDGDDPKNPLNWKSGGSWLRGGYTFEINMGSSNRPWPPPKERSGVCLGTTVLFYEQYAIRGYGWSTWDWGQETLLPAIKSCVGLGVTGWTFDYLDKPGWGGHEWQATFNTPIWTKARCFDNNKVQSKAGGFSDGCHFEKTLE